MSKSPSTTNEAGLYALPTGRRWLNTITRVVVGMGGGTVIVSIALIFAYLLWVVFPIFAGASIESGRSYELSHEGDTVHLDVNESDEIGLAFTQTGTITAWNLEDENIKFSLDLNRQIRKVKPVFPASAQYAVLDDQGQLNFLAASYPISFDGDVRAIGADVSYVYSDAWLDIGQVADFDVFQTNDMVRIAYLDGLTLTLDTYSDAELGFDLEFPRSRSVELERTYDRVIFGPRGQWLYMADAEGMVAIYQISRSGRMSPIHVGALVSDTTSLTALEPLLGRYSLLVADDTGKVTQWFVVRGEFGLALEQVREFSLPQSATSLVPEPRRKGFAAIDRDGEVHLLYTTSARMLASHPIKGTSAAVISPRSDLILGVGSDNRIHSLHLDNEHPDISWSVLWSKIWYEGYAEPVHSWQSSSADNDFEAKFSLTPLLFGTLKAAFYAMLFAVPISIMGALYTAYFMAPVMRRLVKPGIEIMAALPTVILGFLAGLWLAPLIEANLASVITVFAILPIAVLGISLVFRTLPERLVQALDGWYGLIIVPVLIGSVFVAFSLGPLFEDALFGGDSRRWFLDNLGLDYDQRNALVVGLAMGLAVVPTIFSIAEDAIYSVPTQLVNGSLALGATRWQTLMRVVILTASPGIFSAVMIGLGRAVGETMIVLMATGNTPIMDMNIFEGMRTFAANIAVELPESEVDSSHYRILFLTALVLFLITFAFNTVAEVVRQRLRSRYGNL